MAEDRPRIQRRPAAVRALVLPCFTLAFVTMAPIARMTRATMAEVLQSDYVRTARSLGLPFRVVVLRYGLKNALVPILTITGLQFGTLLGGAVVTETVFSWPGMGRLAIQSIYNRDYPVVQSAVFIAAVLFIVINLALDALYGALDHRTREPRA